MAMDYSAYEFLKIEVSERVATVTLNRPEVRNAINSALHHEFEQIWRDLAEDRDVNAILLTGAGAAFSVGGDITGGAKPTKSKGRGGRRIVMADGRRVPSWRVILDSVQVGDVMLLNVEGSVHSGAGIPLLGMSFLNRTEMRNEGEILSLTKRY